MDDHHPAGFGAVKIGAPATVFHEAPSPYAIPYRSLYSRNVPNLMFAGRGVAAALATARGLLPAAMMRHIDELQQTLLRDDAYLPGVAQTFPPALARARLTASPPSVLPKAFRIEGLIGEQWRLLARAERNGQRWCCFPVRVGLDGMRFVLEETWGSPRSRVYAFFTSLQA